MKLTSVIIVSTLCLGLVEVSLAHFPEGTTYPAYQFPDVLVPTIDGDLSDWDIVPEAYRVPIGMFRDRVGGMTEPDTTDLNAWVAVGWNPTTNRLYVACWRYDNIVVVDRPEGNPGMLWQQDDFEVMVDMDHSGGQYAAWTAEQIPDEEERRLAQERQAQQYIFAYPQSDSIYSFMPFTPSTWVYQPPYTECGFTFEGVVHSSGTTTYEISIVPWDELIYYSPDSSTVHMLQEGEVFGMNIALSDFDDPDNPTQYHAYWVLSHQDATFKFAERFTDFLLAPMEWTPPVSVSIPDTSGGLVDTLWVPVNLGDVTGLRGIYSAQMELTFDPDVLEADTVSLEGTLAEGWTVKCRADTGSINIAMAGADSLEGAGPLVYMGFRVVGSLGDTTMIHFENFMFNEGVPYASTSDGAFEVINLFPVVWAVFPGPVGYTDSRITAVFSRGMDPATLNVSTVLVSGSSSGAVSGTVYYQESTNSVTFVPDSPFEEGETVTVTILGNVHDTTGRGLDGDGDGLAEGSPTDDYTWSFVPTSPLVITAYPTAAPPTLDGAISPGEYDATLPVEVNFDDPTTMPGIVPDWIPLPEGHDDLSLTIYAMYDTANLYIAVDVTDDVICDDPGQTWEDDDVEVFLDGDRVSNDYAIHNRGKEGFEILIDVGGEIWDDGGLPYGDWSAASGTRTGGRVYEFKVPLVCIDITDGPGETHPSPGTSVGLNIAVGDDDNGGAPYESPYDSYGAWTGSYDHWTYNRESDWGRLYFGEVPLEVISGTVSDRTTSSPIPGAMVQAWDSYPDGAVVNSSSTSADGSYSLSLPPGTYDIRVYVEGYYPKVLEGQDAPSVGVDVALDSIPEVTPTNEWVDFWSDSTVFLDHPVLVGDVITAHDPSGAVCGVFVVHTRGSYGLMHVYRDDSSTPEDEGARPGEQITFSINGYPAIALGPDDPVWTSNGDSWKVNLSAVREATMTIPLNAGFNLVSWNVDSPEDSVGTLLAGIMDKVIVVLGFEGGGMTYDPELPEFSDLKEMDHLHGYWIKMEGSDTLRVTGTPVDPRSPIYLEEGFNLVSYLPESPDSVAHALADILDKVLVVLGFELGGLTYDPTLPEFSDLKVLKPGFGYWVKTTAPDTLVYPAEQVASGGGGKLVAGGNMHLEVTPTNEWICLYGDKLTICGLPAPVGTKVEAVDPDGVVCGKFIVRREGKYGIMPVYRDDPRTDLDEGAEPGDVLTIYVDGIRSGRAVWTEFGDVQLVNLSVERESSVGVPTRYELFQNYPNPFNTKTTIGYQVPERSHVKLGIYSLGGQVVRMLVNKVLREGRYTVVWDGMDDEGREVASGIYLYRMEAGRFHRIRKMVVVR